VQGDVHAAWTLALGNGSQGGVAVDGAGNIIAAGAFLDRLTVGTHTFTSAAGDTLHPFVLAVDSDDRFLWERTLPGNWQPQGVGLDEGGNIYLAGISGGSPDLGKGQVPGSLLLAKLDPSGKTLWSRGFETFRSANLSVFSKMALATDLAGDVAIIAGESAVPTDFGGGLPAATAANGFIASFASDGTYRFSKTFDGDGSVASVAFDAQGNLVAGGAFRGTLDFGGAALTAGPSGSAFVASFDPMGNLRWSRALGDGSATRAVATSQGRTFASGTFVDHVALSGSSLTALGLRDVFIGVFDDAGGTLGLAGIPGASDTLDALAVDGGGGAVALGVINDYVDLGLGLFAPPALVVARIDGVGHAQAAAAFNAPYGATAGAVAVDASGAMITFGGFETSADLGDGLLTGGSTFEPTMFLAKYAARAAGTAGRHTSCPVAAGALLSYPGSVLPALMALHGDRIFYSTGTEIMSVPVAGGLPSVLASAQKNAVALAVDDTAIFWVNAGRPSYLALPPDGSVVSLPLAGGAPTVLADHLGFADGSPGSPFVAAGIAIDDQSVYWTTATQVLAVPKMGGTPIPLAPANGGPVVTSGGFVVFTTTQPANFAASSQVQRVAIIGGDVATLATTDRTVTSLATDGVTVFWTDGDSPTVDVSTNDSRVRAVPLAGGSPVVLQQNRPSAGFLALSGGDLWWAERGGSNNLNAKGTGGIWHMPKSGTTAVPQTSGVAWVGAFALDASNVAWVGPDSSTGASALEVRAR
jgi:hypothetical protein